MDKNQTVAKKIWHDALQCSMKPFSWGLRFNDIKVIENGTSFYVQGKVCGWIKIQLTEDNRYDTTITPDNALESEVIYRFVSLENIVSHHRCKRTVWRFLLRLYLLYIWAYT